MSRICIPTNISILILYPRVSKLRKSESTEFSKDGVFHSKTVVCTFSKCLNINPTPTLDASGRNFGLCNFTLHYYRKYIEIEFLKSFYLQKFLTSNLRKYMISILIFLSTWML